MEPLGKVGLRLGIEEIRDVRQQAGLLANGFDDLRVRMADVHHGDACEKVEILLPLAVPQRRAFTAHERDRLTPVHIHVVPVLQRLDLVEGLHAVTIVPTP